MNNENDEWLKLQCNKYVNGVCASLLCLKRGLGNDRKKWKLPIDYSKSACESHEILLELQELRHENEMLKNDLAGEDL